MLLSICTLGTALRSHALIEYTTFRIDSFALPYRDSITTRQSRKENFKRYVDASHASCHLGSRRPTRDHVLNSSSDVGRPDLDAARSRHSSTQSHLGAADVSKCAIVADVKVGIELFCSRVGQQQLVRTNVRSGTTVCVRVYLSHWRVREPLSGKRLTQGSPEVFGVNGSIRAIDLLSTGGSATTTTSGHRPCESRRVTYETRLRTCYMSEAVTSFDGVSKVFGLQKFQDADSR